MRQSFVSCNDHYDEEGIILEKLKITVGGKEFYAKLLQDKAPKTIAQMKEHGPIHTVMHAAKVVNEEVMCPAPYFYEAKENPVFDQDPGNVCFYAQKHTIAIFFGDVIPVADCPNFAKIEEDSLPGFQEVARTAWKNQGQPITFEVVNV